MAHILVVSGHPDLNHSIANATILDEVETALPDAEIRRLDRLYPHGNINISAEQESLLRQIVRLAAENGLEASDRILELDVAALHAGEILRDMERLREETLDAS